MADQDMRLRLVVRRNGLPELRLVWHVHLDTNPTISRLLEQLNDQVPLESDHWGLEDYVVELHDSDGTDFECLHYQSVRSVLKPDDRVFIRALDRDDHRRRRVSGRHQVSSDGRHLIDGVPFGRPYLRTVNGRPNVYIPPPKRARYTYTEQEGDGFGTEGGSPVRLLTNGHLHENSQEAPGGSGDTDPNADDSDFTTDDAESSSLSSSVSEPHIGEEEDEEDTVQSEEGGDLDQEVRDLAVENAAFERRDGSKVQVTGLSTLDKLNALRVAFPRAPIDICEKVLVASNGNLKKTYSVLSEGFRSQVPWETVIAQGSRKGNPRGDLEESRASISSAPFETTHTPVARKRKFREESITYDSDKDEDRNNQDSLWRKYDHAGFPPGTITSGRGLAQMAAISSSFGNTNINNNSEATSTSLKAPAFEADEGSEDTSSSGSSSESSTGDDEPGYINERGSPSGHSSSPSSSADSDDSDSDESDSDDSDLDESDSDDSDNSSEWTDSVMANDVRFTSFSTNESDMSDSDRSSDKEEPSGFSEFSDNVFESEHREIDSTSAAVQSCSSSSKVRKENLRPIPAPPGAGKERTKRRNARRRAAKLAKKLQGPDLNNPNATTIKRIPDGDGDPGGNNNKSALFEAKRKALLDAIATGGIEICPSGETTFDHGFGEAAREKRKHINEGGADRLHDKNEAIGEIAKTSPGDSEESAGHKRRRVDLGAGRRLVFGALGVRAPKNKEDEDELRDQLQANAQPHIDRQDSSHAQPTLGEALCARDEQGTDVWKLKINYRAVECCEDNTKLGPAPFPFQQRWDPQQQYSSTPKKKQRGGQSKRAQRNQNQYYNSNPLDRKRKRCYSHGSVDGSCDRREDTVDGFDVTLNYDDIDNQSRDRNETSQTTDLDDLPSLPKDVSELPSLRPGEARPGMVITWLKWRCSSATGWQPQLSRVAAIVARVDDSGTMLRVCLAKRDRLDEDEKRYDPKTGQRIYDRFEAPELREEDEADDHDNIGMDEGYRDVPWAEMQDPKILQQPLDPTIELVPNSKCISSVEMHDKTANRNADRAGPIADLPNIYSVTSLTRPNDHEPMHTLSKGNIPVGEAPESTGSPKERPGESSIESRVEVASNAMSQRTRQKQQTTDLAVSDTSQISSPSRQLLETTSQAMVSNSPTRNWAPASSVELGESPRADTSSCVPVPISVSSQSRLEEDCGSDIISGTPKAVFDQEATPSSASSAQSGRQLDYDMNIGDQIPGPFDATDDIGRQSYGLEQNTSPSARRSLTPTANRQTVTHDHENKQPLDGVIGSSPLARSTSGSLSSLSPLWCTALTSHSTQNSSGALELSITPKPNVSSSSRDATYEAAMRKLDTQFSDASSPPPADDGLEVKREDPTQFQAETREAISPPPRRRCFTIPEGTQIVELSSDSEPTYTENYADDAIDGTYSPRSDSLPRGDGWVTKRRDAIRRKARKSVV